MSALKDVKIDDKEFDKIEAMIYSMTKKEKKDVRILNASRRRRIVAGSGTTIQDLNKFINAYEQTEKMMKDPAKMQNMMNKLNLK